MSICRKDKYLKYRIRLKQLGICVLTIGLIFVSNKGLSSNIICFEADGKVSIESINTKNPHASKRDNQLEKSPLSINQCLDILIISENEIALKSTVSINTSPSMSEIYWIIPPNQLAARRLNISLNQYPAPIYLSPTLYVLQKTVLLN